MAIKLPTEREKEGYSLENIRALFYGLPKIGKSTFAAKFDHAVFLATEKGLKGLNVYKIDITEWSDFGEAVDLLLNKKHNFKTVIVDTADNLFKFCKEYICAKNKIAHPSDSKWGKGWDLIQREFERDILRLAMSDMGIIFISHAAESEVKTRSATFSKTGPTIPNQARKVIMPLVDIIGYCYIEEVNKQETRFIQFNPTEYVEAGDRTGLLPQNMKLNYQKFRRCFTPDEDND